MVRGSCSRAGGVDLGLANMIRDAAETREGAPMTVRVGRDGPVTIVTIDRPEVRNAVDGPTAARLSEAFRAFDADDSSSIAVLTGAGDTFCAGADLKAVLALVEAGRMADVSGLVRRFQALNQALRFSAVPIVVACHGLTLGGGCELALHASRVVAARDSYLGLVEVGAGLIPAGGGCKELVRRLDEAWPTDLEFDGLHML